MHHRIPVLSVVAVLSWGGMYVPDADAQGYGHAAMHGAPAGQGSEHGSHHAHMHGMMHPGDHGVQGEAHGHTDGPSAGSGTGRSYDGAFSADMNLVYQLLHAHDRIERSVTRLPDGIRTLTESNDAQVAQALKAHVSSMMERLREARVFNLFSDTLPVLFAKKERIETRVETTRNGIAVTQTSKDPEVVAALQGHADEVSELARDGMIAMMRGMHRNMAMMRRGAAFGQDRRASPAQ